MSKPPAPLELRISAAIPVPNELFAQAEVLAKMQTVVEALKEEFRKATGGDIHVEAKLCRINGPRGQTKSAYEIQLEERAQSRAARTA